MSKRRKNKKLKRTKDYFPITNPDKLDEDTNVSLPSGQDIKRAKNWVDKTQK